MRKQLPPPAEDKGGSRGSIGRLKPREGTKLLRSGRFGVEGEAERRKEEPPPFPDHRRFVGSNHSPTVGREKEGGEERRKKAGKRQGRIASRVFDWNCCCR